MIDLTTLPDRMKKLPVVDYHGFGPMPVPFFVDWLDGKPEFRAMDRRKFVQAIKQRLCWVCGDPLGRWLAFPIGPMCAITRTTSEPPCHRECAVWSIVHCPFLSNPQMVRRTEGLPEGGIAAGTAILRNPGTMCLWTTREYETFADDKGMLLLTVGKPERIEWWREGRTATREEVQASIDSGLPNLLALARAEGAFAVEALGTQVHALDPWLPPLAAVNVGQAHRERLTPRPGRCR